MKSNLFEIGAKISDGWSFDEKSKVTEEKLIPKNSHQLVFTFEKRNGKPVTLVGRFYIASDEKKAILNILKKKLSTGGTINGEWLEIQGDMKPKIKEILAKEGWKFK